MGPTCRTALGLTSVSDVRGSAPDAVASSAVDDRTGIRAVRALVGGVPRFVGAVEPLTDSISLRSLDAHAGQSVRLRWRKEAASSNYARVDRVLITGNGAPCPAGQIFADDFGSGGLSPTRWPVSSGVFVGAGGTCSGNDMARLQLGDSMQTRDLDLSCATRAELLCPALCL